MYPDHGYLVSQLKQRNLPGMRGVSHWTGQPLVHRIIPVNSSQETPRYIHLKTPVQNAKTTRNTIEKRTLAFQKTSPLQNINHFVGVRQDCMATNDMHLISGTPVREPWWESRLHVPTSKKNTLLAN